MAKRTGKDKKEWRNYRKEEHGIYKLRVAGRLPAPKKRIRLIDLFCGAGGMSLGFSTRFGHYFRSVWANDFDKRCVETYNANFGPHCIHGDIVNILRNPKVEIPKADIVIGGPPCQGFSLLNKNRNGDMRKHLWRPYFEIIERSGAKIFVMENVPQLLRSPEFEDIIGKAEDLGFKVWSGVLCAADYGVPQSRKRAIVIGCKFFDPSDICAPLKTHVGPIKRGNGKASSTIGNNGYFPKPKRWRTVRDAIADLPIPKGTEIRKEETPLNLHFGRSPLPSSLARYKAIPKEGMNRFDLQRRAPELTPACWIRKKTGGTDLFGRLWWDRPAFTIRTEFFKPEKGRYLHPKQHRPITHREAARIQSFPDDFIFRGSKIEIARQIGNAVPPLLASRIADTVYLMMTYDSK